MYTCIHLIENYGHCTHTFITYFKNTICCFKNNWSNHSLLILVGEEGEFLLTEEMTFSSKKDFGSCAYMWSGDWMLYVLYVPFSIKVKLRWLNEITFFLFYTFALTRAHTKQYIAPDEHQQECFETISKIFLIMNDASCCVHSCVYHRSHSHKPRNSVQTWFYCFAFFETKVNITKSQQL